MGNGQKLLASRADIVFKALFTKENNRDFLVSFIVRCLGMEIADTKLAPSYQLDKLSRLDIRANMANKSILDIKIQFYFMKFKAIFRDGLYQFKLV